MIITFNVRLRNKAHVNGMNLKLPKGFDTEFTAEAKTLSSANVLVLCGPLHISVPAVM